MRNPNRGFTLLEMVIAMVVLSIIMIGMGSYIAVGVKGYTNTVDRERLQSQARFLIARMTREIRHAAPNSLSVAGSKASKDMCLSFYPIVSAAVYYADLPNNSDQLNISALDPQNTAIWKPKDRKHKGWKVAVGFASAEQYKENTIVMSAAEPLGDLLQLSLTYPITTSSPGKRLYLYQHQISYCQVGNTIQRQVNGNKSVLMATNIELFDPIAQPTGLNSNAIALIGIKFKDPITNETADYNHSVQVLNVL